LSALANRQQRNTPLPPKHVFDCIEHIFTLLMVSCTFAEGTVKNGKNEEKNKRGCIISYHIIFNLHSTLQQFDCIHKAIKIGAYGVERRT